MNKVVCIVGLGYVGLPLAVEFAKNNFEVIGFDINKKRISELEKGIDYSNQLSEAEILKYKIKFTFNPDEIRKADFIIVAVPTPIFEDSKEPDLRPVESASKLVGKNLKKGSIIVYESTVYPGVTEDVCVPILEKESGLKCGKDFKVGYSPERVNPGDNVHTLDKIVKVVSGMDKETLDKVSWLYGSIIKAGVYEASSIKVAEAAKVIENTQRDLNIALINELVLIFHRMGIDTREVIKAASTKWNFHPYYPGLVGGHCISVDPHYLLHKAKALGYNPKVILAGREVNDYMPFYVVELLKKALKDAEKKGKNLKILVAGLTFKENLKDTRNSKSEDVIKCLKKDGFMVYCYDPLLSKEECEKFGAKYCDFIKNTDMKFDAFLLLVSHKEFYGLSLEKLGNIMNSPKILIDIKAIFDKKEAIKKGFLYYTF